MTETILPIPKQYVFDFFRESGKQVILFMFPAMTVCSKCDFAQEIGIKGNQMRIVEHHRPDCEYYE
jgi:hypothetical protein